MSDFSTTIIFSIVDKSNVFNALTNAITEWWTEMVEGSANEKGKSFTIWFGANIFKKMLVEELILNKKIVWTVTDSLINIPDLKNKTEWVHTKIVWELSEKNNKTILKLTHLGLTPQVECYTVCESGWHSFTESLYKYITTGKGTPYKN